jgi:hypothetical protein
MDSSFTGKELYLLQTMLQNAYWSKPGGLKLFCKSSSIRKNKTYHKPDDIIVKYLGLEFNISRFVFMKDEDLPLYINSGSITEQTICKWRLGLGK